MKKKKKKKKKKKNFGGQNRFFERKPLQNMQRFPYSTLNFKKLKFRVAGGWEGDHWFVLDFMNDAPESDDFQCDVFDVLDRFAIDRWT